MFEGERIIIDDSLNALLTVNDLKFYFVAICDKKITDLKR